MGALDQGTVLVLLVAAVGWLAMLAALGAQRSDRREVASVTDDSSDGTAAPIDQPAMYMYVAASAPPAPACWFGRPRSAVCEAVAELRKCGRRARRGARAKKRVLTNVFVKCKPSVVK